jgi:lipopolysaccharide transport system ATP-binding protein
MGYVRATDVVVAFPLYDMSSRSLKKAFVRAATGGMLARDAANRVVVRALDGVSFEMREGDRIGLIGHNGSGKTTLLRVIAGAYEPISGSVEIRGRVASMLDINLGIDPEATGLENIYIRAAIMGLSHRKVDSMIDDIAAFAELGDYLEMPMRTYSSGMAMRLAFAISTSVPTDIILMDEWLSVGDEQYSIKAQARLRELLEQAKILVLASHEPGLIKATCNRVIRLDHGKLIEGGL